MSKLTRRAVMGSVPALAAGRAAAASANGANVKGLKTYSESAMVMAVSADGRAGATLRFCRFPDVGVTWVWLHLLRDGETYAFTDPDLPCTKERLAGTPSAAYRASGAILAREGGGAGLKDVRIEASLPAHHSKDAPNGPGTSKARLSAVFKPAHMLGAPVLEGRDEVYGTVRGTIEVAGRALVLEGPAKFHEQRQEAPRFGPPFCYSWLAGPDMAATTLLVTQGATGGWALRDGDLTLTEMTIDPPGLRRSVDYRFAGGRRMEGELEALARFTVPIYDRAWEGSFVKGRVDGKPVVGMANDWTTQPDIYALARARAGKAG